MAVYKCLLSGAQEKELLNLKRYADLPGSRAERREKEDATEISCQVNKWKIKILKTGIRHQQSFSAADLAKEDAGGRRIP